MSNNVILISVVTIFCLIFYSLVKLIKTKDEVIKTKDEEIQTVIKTKDEALKTKDEALKTKDEEIQTVIKTTDEALKYQMLISTMENFIANNLSTARKSSAAGRSIQNVVVIGKVETLLKNGDITLLNTLSKKNWKTFCKNITKVQNNELSEHKGVHPLVNELVQTTLQSTTQPSQYCTQKEGLKVDEEMIVKIPDISITLNECKSKAMTSIVVPIEIKKKGNCVGAIYQSLGYLMSKLLDQLEIASDVNTKLFGYCIGTDGNVLNLGYISIENYRVFASIGVEIDLWDGENRFVR